MRTLKSKFSVLIILFFLLHSCTENHSPKLSGIFNLYNNQSSTSTSYFTVSGTVSGLAGNLRLSLNNSETLTLTSDGSFSFTTSLTTGISYTVTIVSYSTGQYCSIQNSSGTISANVTNVSVTCQTGNSNGPLVGGTVFNPLSLSYNLTTIASGALYSGVNGVTTDGSLIYFTTDINHTILKLDPSTNTLTIIAGQSGIAGFTNGAALSATFNGPEGTVYLNNALYITDVNNNAVRKLDLTSSTVSTFATGVTAPYGITTDGSYLYLTETGKVTKIQITTGTVTVIAGSGVTGYADGVGAAAKFSPNGTINGGITFDGTDLYVNDRGNCSIRKVVISSGTVTTIVGSPPPTVSCGTLLDGIGTAALINLTDGIVSDGTNIYLADTGSCVIRKIQMSTLTVTTVVGLSGTCALVDGSGTAARLGNPALMTSDGTSLFIADWGNNAIRKLN